ncbi:MAG: hypothetical protein Kow0092_19000 [Deferrisomatales bacterium]
MGGFQCETRGQDVVGGDAVGQVDHPGFRADAQNDAFHHPGVDVGGAEIGGQDDRWWALDSWGARAYIGSRHSPQIQWKEVNDMKRFMVPRVAHCSEGCPTGSWA